MTSDHLPILAWIDLKPFMINVPTASFYQRTDLAANNLFKQILASTNWNSIETSCAANDVSAAYDQFELIIKKAYNTTFTKKTNKMYSKNLNNLG